MTYARSTSQVPQPPQPHSRPPYDDGSPHREEQSAQTQRASRKRPIRVDFRTLLPVCSALLVLVPIFVLQPTTLSYFGINMLFNLGVPIVLASLAQLAVITANELDLSIGSFVSLVTCIGSTLLVSHPYLGIAVLLGCILLYALLGALIAARGVSSVVVTLGLSFVWNGIAVYLLPQPGGTTPNWLATLMSYPMPGVPLPVVLTIAVAVIAHLVLMRSPFGVGLRGVGGNPRAMQRFGWSVVGSKAMLFGLAGLCGVGSGLCLLGLSTSGDANIALRYTLISVAAVILGGGEFSGARVSAIGTVLGAVTLTLAASFLSFLQIAPEWQIGVQGAILIVVLSLRLLSRQRRPRY